MFQIKVTDLNETYISCYVTIHCTTNRFYRINEIRFEL